MRLTLKIIFPVFFIVVFASCRENWSRQTKDSFYTACTEEAVKWAGSEQKAKEYCDCVFAKMYKKYPHEEDALQHIDSLAVDPDLIGCKDEVMKK
jgi:hypothetical protein